MNTLPRLLASLVCMVSVSVAMPLSANAADGEPAMSDDGPVESRDEPDDRDVPPPNGGEEGERQDRDEPERASDNAPRQSEPPSRPSPSSPASDRAAREAARRALFSDPKKDADKPNPLLDARGPDYYDRRAKELLQEDAEKGAVALHPLMQAYPDSYVVVCTGGCPSGAAADIVSLLPRSPAPPAPVSKPDTQDPAEISCVAGCGAAGGMAIAGAPSPSGTAVAATVGEWVTSLSKLPAGVDPSAPSNGGSGDWMNTINRDRATKTADATPKTVKPTAPASEPKKAEPPPVEAPGVKLAPAVAAKPAPAAEEKQQNAKAPEPAKPPQAVTAAPPLAKPVAAESKPVAATELKPVEAKPDQAKPAEIKAAEPKLSQPELNAVKTAEAAKPATPAVIPPVAAVTAAAEPKAVAAAEATKPAPAAPAVAPPKDTAKSPVSTPTVAAPASEKAAAVPQKPADAVAKPAAPTAAPAAAKPEAVAQKPATSEPQQMAALDPAKAPPAAAPVKPVVAEKQPAPAASAAAAPAEKPAAPPKDSSKIAALSPPEAAKPEAKPAAAPKERVISVLSEDREMNAAIEKSRGSLGSFWRSYDTPASGETDHALKVAIPGNGTTEHFWLTRIKRENGKISGVISNQPQSVTTVKMGQRYEFTPDMISDWTFKRNGKLVGNETMRVLLPRMPEEQAAVYRQMYETP